jgi:hypothetical protein
VHLCPEKINELTFSGSRQFCRYLFAETSDSLRDCANDNQPLFIIEENYRLGLIYSQNSPLGYPPDFDRSKMLASDLRKNEAAIPLVSCKTLIITSVFTRDRAG